MHEETTKHLDVFRLVARIIGDMKCAKLPLLERSKPRIKLEVNLDKPRRYCQKRMVNPDHEEDPRWNDLGDRFYCSSSNEARNFHKTCDNLGIQQEVEDLFLSVQNIQFNGDVQHRKRPRTSFKYTALSNGKKHRMFVKQMVNCENDEPDGLSELNCYYFDDYVKYYLSGNDRSRQSSAKSTTYFHSDINKNSENKSTQADITQGKATRKPRCSDAKTKISTKRDAKLESRDEIKNAQEENNIEDTKIFFQSRGRRKSLTISKTESLATVQIIRVEVVCNYSCSSTMSDYDDKKQTSNDDLHHTLEEGDKERDIVKVKNTRFANKYLLTKSVKTLDENVSGGSKVTLLCKTFRLADRSNFISKRKTSKNLKNVSSTVKKF